MKPRKSAVAAPRKRRVRRIALNAVVATVACAALLWLACLNFRTYRPGRLDTAVAQLAFLEGALHEGAGERMQALFPEGYVFTWSLYGLASAQAAAALPHDARRAQLLHAAADAVAHVQSDVARRTFVREMDPEYGAYYQSWSLYLRSVVLRSLPPGDAVPFDTAAYGRDCERFADALRRSPSPYLPSYPDGVWPADTGVGIAALAIRDEVLGPRYAPVIRAWVRAVNARVDPATGAIPHGERVEGWPGDGPRGESLALLSIALQDVDASLARRQYRMLRAHFVDYRWGLPGVREYPRGVDGQGDVDSGPLVLGFSGPATVVGAGAALVHGDERTGDALLATAEVLGFPVQWRGHRWYAAGTLPVGDAFLAWVRTLPPGAPGASSYPTRVVPWAWRVPLHVVSLLVATGLVLLARNAVRRIRATWRGAGAVVAGRMQPEGAEAG